MKNVHFLGPSYLQCFEAMMMCALCCACAKSAIPNEVNSNLHAWDPLPAPHLSLCPALPLSLCTRVFFGSDDMSL